MYSTQSGKATAGRRVRQILEFAKILTSTWCINELLKRLFKGFLHFIPVQVAELVKERCNVKLLFCKELLSLSLTRTVNTLYLQRIELLFSCRVKFRTELDSLVVLQRVNVVRFSYVESVTFELVFYQVVGTRTCDITKHTRYEERFA